MTDPLFGPYMQNAFVVEDLDAAIDHWVTVMKVGPFFKFPPLSFDKGWYRGAPATISFTAAIAYSGDLQIELMTPTDTPSIFRDALEAGHVHVHHLCAFTGDMAAAQADFEARGATLVQAFDLEDGGKCAYLDMNRPDGLMVELADMSDGVMKIFSDLKRAAAEWDGKTQLIKL